MPEQVPWHSEQKVAPDIAFEPVQTSGVVPSEVVSDVPAILSTPYSDFQLPITTPDTVTADLEILAVAEEMIGASKHPTNEDYLDRLSQAVVEIQGK